MQVSSINRPSYSFKAQYSTVDVLSFTTSYPFNDTYKQPEMVKELTGIDLRSDEFKKSVPQNYDAGFLELAIIGVCVDKILSQNDLLKSVDDTFVPRAQNKQVKKENKAWLKKQLKILGKTINIEPFSINPNEVKKAYKDLIDVLNKIF